MRQFKALTAKHAKKGRRVREGIPGSLLQLLKLGLKSFPETGIPRYRGYPSPPRIFGIIELEENLGKIYVLQSLAGKILSRKDLLLT